MSHRASAFAHLGRFDGEGEQAEAGIFAVAGNQFLGGGLDSPMQGGTVRRELDLRSGEFPGQHLVVAGVPRSGLPLPEAVQVWQWGHVVVRQDADQRPTAGVQPCFRENVADRRRVDLTCFAGPHEIEPCLDDAPPVRDPILLLDEGLAVGTQIVKREMVEIWVPLRSVRPGGVLRGGRRWSGPSGHTFRAHVAPSLGRVKESAILLSPRSLAGIGGLSEPLEHPIGASSACHPDSGIAPFTARWSPEAEIGSAQPSRLRFVVSTSVNRTAATRAAASRGTAVRGKGQSSAPPDRARVRQARAIAKALAELYPDAHCELNFSNPLELLVATILSAQCTDQRVNMVTPALFAKYRSAADYAAADRAELEKLIASTGFYRNKTAAIIGMAQALCERFGGEVPDRLDDLVTLPGVGRKTANVVLGTAFGIPGITVDTHVLRLAKRFGWTTSNDPVVVEQEIAALIPREEWTALSHRMIWHGRRVCHARKPACGACGLARLCPSYGIGPTDPVEAAKLVKAGPVDALR